MIHYHPEKANVVAYALSRKSSAMLASLYNIPNTLFNELRSLRAKLQERTTRALMAIYDVKLVLIDRICDAQQVDPFVMRVKSEITEKKEI